MIGIILSLFLLFSLEGRAQWFTVEGGESGDYTYEGGVLIVNKSTLITIRGETSHRIEVKGGGAYITLENVNIQSSEGSPFYIHDGASVNLSIQGNNTLKALSGNHAALHCSLEASLIIDGGGELTAMGGTSSAGIGGSNHDAGGTITINGGTVMATGGNYGAGIGGSKDAVGGSITIQNSGNVIATGGQYAAGIGGGENGYGGNITIKGGTVTATGGQNAAGIGGGANNLGGKITISGGIVTATGGYDGGAGIGNGNNASADFDASFFTTTAEGNAFIQATSISDKRKQDSWSGVIFEENTGIVYGKSLTLPKGEITIPSGKTLDIDEGKTLTIGKGTTLTIGGGTTLTNNGVIGVAGTLTNNGTYQGNGKLYKLEGGTINGIAAFEEGVIITFNANAGDGDDLVTNLPPTQIIKKNTEPTIKATPTRTNYTLVGWSTTAKGNPITDWSDVTNTDVELYALWKRNTTLELNANSYSYTYGDNAPTVEAKLKVEGENPSSPTETISYSFYSEVECINYIKTSDVKDAGTYYVKASYPGDNNNMKAETAAISYEIKKKELTVTPTAGQTIYLDEHPAFTVSGAVSTEEPAFTGKLGVNDNSPKKITVGNLELADGEKGFKAANYTWELSSSQVEIAVEDQTLKDALIEASSLTTDWMKDKVTLKAPANFKIAAVSPLRSATTPDWKAQIEIEKAGDYDFECQLKRNGATSVYTILIPIKLDNIVPTINVAASNLSVTVDLSDNLSGLASCTYNWNNGGDQSVTLTQGENTKSFTLTGAEGIYPLKVILTDQAGNEATYVGQVTLKENRPTPPPTPTPIYYTVSLPAVEGAITDPAAGDHPVESWDSFSFTIALDADYSESVPLVTVDGTVLTPRESDGKYIIKWVRHDMAVEISGIVKNIPTGTDDIQASAVDIRQSAGVLCIDTPQPLEGKIYSAAGTELRTLRLSAGTNRVYGLPQGVCIIRLSDETTRKVIIATH